jgi:hypothetical protein
VKLNFGHLSEKVAILIQEDNLWEGGNTVRSLYSRLTSVDCGWHGLDLSVVLEGLALRTRAGSVRRTSRILPYTLCTAQSGRLAR